ncbi:unnamed protein product [Rotaria socialis]|uniref:Uncharacterized protein n=1 Tax=Rotaria socialis TaxID=392032 RepID=A0A821RER5_9BILA|nr:unnamed protein product [Rotaria socialis]
MSKNISKRENKPSSNSGREHADDLPELKTCNFSSAIKFLCQDTNRSAGIQRDRYYKCFEASHKHISKALAIFYYYDSSHILQVTDVKEHFGDRNRWRSA